MGKVDIPKEGHFLKKILLAMAILVTLVVMAQLAFMEQGMGLDKSFSKSISIVTHVDVVNEQISFKYFFALLSVLGGVVQFYLIYVVLEYILEGKFHNIFSGVRHMNKVKNMKDHYIIAGGGRVGSHAATLLKSYGKEVVLIDNNEAVVEKLRSQGFTALRGDVLDEAFLKEVNIEKAKQLLACLGRDSDNILLVLTSRELNPGLKVSARANHESVIPKLQHAGASHVVVPSSLGGEELAKTATRSED